MMYFSLTVMILCTAIIVFFIDEFTSVYKKIIKIPGVKLFVPLIVISWLVTENLNSITLVILNIFTSLAMLSCLLASILPFSGFSLPVAQFIILSTFSILPGLAVAWHLEKTFQSLQPAWLLMAVLFTIFSLMLLGANLKLC